MTAKEKSLPVTVFPKKTDGLLEEFRGEMVERDIILEDKDMLSTTLQALGHTTHMRFIDALFAIRRMFSDNDEFNLVRQAYP